MAALSTQVIEDDGFYPTFAAAAASDTAEIGSGRNTYAHYKNDSGSSVTVTVLVPGTTFFGLANPDNAVVVAAGAETLIPLRKAYDDGTGRATITTSSQTSVTVAVVKVA
ncbi:hypothetical protein [Rhodococcus sp. 11-3]|uniref:hypothetical protein n=1 Tax=Rhodococcus sp. 11-3 TaxID=2854796 RepID=UPI00203EACE5|nr:hypothetical protein [Rhodococcus sp. 11-3]USC17037.1 hypothetical protein KZJ41_09295 [Rhodococcus sp. 11-3]